MLTSYQNRSYEYASSFGLWVSRRILFFLGSFFDKLCEFREYPLTINVFTKDEVLVNHNVKRFLNPRWNKTELKAFEKQIVGDKRATIQCFENYQAPR